MTYKQTAHLTPPQLTSSNIKEKITCIRAHRERLFLIAPEKRKNSLIFNNYGHGGAGWTFLFGCVAESMRQFDRELTNNPTLKKLPITVVGAGCYGLLTALELAHKGHSVHIIAKEINNITSYKAAGFFFPRHRKCSTNAEKAVFKNLGIESYENYLSIIKGIHPFINTGPQLLPAYYSPDIAPGFTPYIEQQLMQQPKNVRIDFNNGKAYDMVEYHSLFINPTIMMQQLNDATKRYHIKIITQEITSFDELDAPIIFNCSGLGAKQLTNDTRIVPVQGHLITLKNQPRQALQYMINAKVVMYDTMGRPRDELMYFAPKNEGILGITFIRGQNSLTANQHEFERLLERCHNFFGT